MSTGQTIERRRTEWSPWLAIVGAILDGIEDQAWESFVPDGRPFRRDGAPLLANAELRFDGRVRRLFSNLQHRAAYSGSRRISALDAVRDDDVPEIFHAALNGMNEPLIRIARDSDADANAFRAVAGLLPFPFLHACARRWTGSISSGWTEGYCPVCGAWPACAEYCDVDQTHHLRCGRCGSGWRVDGLSCPYCATTDHEQFASLRPEKNGGLILLEVCNRCRGYVKVFHTQKPGTPVGVMLDDLSSAEFDLVAMERGYSRPPGLGHSLDITLLRA
jgi:FdhE protein